MLVAAAEEDMAVEGASAAAALHHTCQYLIGLHCDLRAETSRRYFEHLTLPAQLENTTKEKSLRENAYMNLVCLLMARNEHLHEK